MAFLTAQLASTYLTFSLLSQQSSSMKAQLEAMNKQIDLQQSTYDLQDTIGVNQASDPYREMQLLNTALSRDVQASLNDKAYQLNVASGIHSGVLTPDGRQVKDANWRLLAPLEKFSAIGRLTPIKEDRQRIVSWIYGLPEGKTGQTSAKKQYRTTSVGPSSWQ